MSERWAKIRTGHLPNANLPRYFSDIVDTWYGLFEKAVSSSAWVALNEIGWLMNDGRERLWLIWDAIPRLEGLRKATEYLEIAYLQTEMWPQNLTKMKQEFLQ